MRRYSAPTRTLIVAAPFAVLFGALGATLAFEPPPLLVWNASESAPPGLYAVQPGAAAARGDLVLAWAPDVARALAAQRRYLPGNVPLIKRVVAAQGDLVCARGERVSVNQVIVARRRRADRHQRPLPAWQGCERLESGKFLLLMPHPDSFDGRYFGPSAPSAVIGKVVPLWTG